MPKNLCHMICPHEIWTDKHYAICCSNRYPMPKYDCRYVSFARNCAGRGQQQDMPGHPTRPVWEGNGQCRHAHFDKHDSVFHPVWPEPASGLWISGVVSGLNDGTPESADSSNSAGCSWLPTLHNTPKGNGRAFSVMLSTPCNKDWERNSSDPKNPPEANHVESRGSNVSLSGSRLVQISQLKVTGTAGSSFPEAGEVLSR